MTKLEIEILQIFEKLFKEINNTDQGIIMSKLYLDLKEKNRFVDFVNWERKRNQ